MSAQFAVDYHVASGTRAGEAGTVYVHSADAKSFKKADIYAASRKAAAKAKAKLAKTHGKLTVLAVRCVG